MEEVRDIDGGPVLQEKKQPSKRAKWIKRIVLGLVALIALLFSGLVIAVTVYEDEIVTYALQTVQGNSLEQLPFRFHSIQRCVCGREF
jgi:cytoskeletal protein RodZ